MYKRFTVLMMVIFSGCNSFLSPEDTAKSYMPLSDGNDWVYKYTFPYFLHDSTTTFEAKLIAGEVGDTMLWFGVNGSPGGCLGSTLGNGESRLIAPCDRFRRDGEKIFRQRTLEFGTSNKLILEFPASYGEMLYNVLNDHSTVDTSGTIHYDYGFAKRFYLNNEDVSVGGKVYRNCIHVRDSSGSFLSPNTGHVYLSHWGDIRSSDEWYAAGVGLVRQIFAWESYYTRPDSNWSTKATWKLELQSHQVNN